jgi:hypothetical protein
VIISRGSQQRPPAAGAPYHAAAAAVGVGGAAVRHTPGDGCSLAAITALYSGPPSLAELGSAACPPTPPLALFCRFQSSRTSGGWNSGPAADQVRRGESQLLSAWTNERLMQLAAGGTMALVLLLLFSAGGPPPDPRCTLPWC